MAKVLIIDDSKMMRTVERAMLVDMGHEVVGEAMNGLEGYDRYFELKPDIVIMDVTMPVLDGIETLRKIVEKDKDVKVILLTSNTNTEKLKFAVEAGVSEILFKPVDEERLRKTIDQILQRS